jgi:negative regulator of flagellin synthesis FlgM
MSIQGTRASGTTTATIVDFAKHKETREAAAGQKSSNADSSGITEGARELAQARDVVEASPEVRAEKVAALKAAIANGTYNADPREIARSLLEKGL